MNCDWMTIRDPDVVDAKAFNGLAKTLMRFKVVDYFDMYYSDNDNGGCGDPQCCGSSYERCEVEVRPIGTNRIIEYEIFERDY